MKKKSQILIIIFFISFLAGCSVKTGGNVDSGSGTIRLPAVACECQNCGKRGIVLDITLVYSGSAGSSEIQQKNDAINNTIRDFCSKLQNELNDIQQFEKSREKLRLSINSLLKNTRIEKIVFNRISTDN